MHGMYLVKIYAEIPVVTSEEVLSKATCLTPNYASGIFA
jgi:hypothetical protein